MKAGRKPSHPGYGGWANYQTWAVHQSLCHDYWQARARECFAVAPGNNGKSTRVVNAAELLSEELRESFEAGRPLADGAWRDLLTHTVGQVDWHAIALCYLHNVGLKP